MASPIQDWQDAFGYQVARGTTNVADLPGHYEATPERWRLYSGAPTSANRIFLQYGSSPKYSHTGGTHVLKPAAGETLTFETAERFRYIVQYVLEWSFALQTNQSLQSGDKITVAYGDADQPGNAASADGWVWEFTPDLADDEVRVIMYRTGSVQDDATVTLRKPLTTWRRLATPFNWYGVGKAGWIETFTEFGDQENPVQAETSADDAKGPETANKRIQVQVTAGGSTSNLELEFGSVGASILGDVTAIDRHKAWEASGLNYAPTSTGNWYPLYALRVNPNRPLVNVQLTEVDPVNFGGTGSGEALIVAVDPSKTNANFDDPEDADTNPGPASPPQLSGANSAIQYTKDVTQFPDSSGTVQTEASDPGGYQIGYGSTLKTQPNQVPSSASRTTKRNLYDGDVAVVLAKASSTGDFTIDFATGQDW